MHISLLMEHEATTGLRLSGVFGMGFSRF